MQRCAKCGSTAADGLFFCPACGVRFGTPSATPPPLSTETTAEGHAPTIPSRNPPPMPSDVGFRPPGEDLRVLAGSIVDEHTRAYGRDSASQANFLPKRERLRSLVVQPTIGRHIARIADAVRAKRLPLGIVVEIAVLVACADNEVDSHEYIALEDVVSATLGDIDAGLRTGVVDAAIAKLRTHSYDARTREAGAAIAAVGASEDALVLAFALAFASEDLSIPERGVIDALAEAMNAPPDAAARARSIVRGVIET